VAFVALTIAAATLAFCVQQRPPSTVSPLSPFAAKTPTPSPTQSVPGNLLTNPSLEGPYVNCGESCNIAPGWAVWTSLTLTPPCIAGEDGCYIPCPSNCEDCTIDYGCWWMKAEYKAATLQFPERVHSGESAQQAFTFGRMGEFGVRQQVSVTIGALLELSGYAQGWQECWPAQQGNCPQANMNLRIGIDPYGGTDPYSANVVWSNYTESFDAYAYISLVATARANTVTVFTYARPQWDWARRNNDAYWDDLALVAIVPTAMPTPSATPEPTPTQGPVVAWLYLPCIWRNWHEEPKPTYTPTPAPAPSVYVEPQYRQVSLGDVFTESVYMQGVTNVVSIESRLYHNATALKAFAITCDLPCDKERAVKMQPGVVALTCESSKAIDNGLLYRVAFTATAAGVFTIEPFTFAGRENGAAYIPQSWWWGFPVDITDGVVEVR